MNVSWLIATTLFASSIIANAEPINLKPGDVHLNEATGTFASQLAGDFSIIVSTDYENEAMDAVVINNETEEIFCLPIPCEDDSEKNVEQR